MKFHPTAISGIFAAGVLAYYGIANFLLNQISTLALLGVSFLWLSALQHSSNMATMPLRVPKGTVSCTIFLS